MRERGLRRRRLSNLWAPPTQDKMDGEAVMWLAEGHTKPAEITYRLGVGTTAASAIQLAQLHVQHLDDYGEVGEDIGCLSLRKEGKQRSNSQVQAGSASCLECTHPSGEAPGLRPPSRWTPLRNSCPVSSGRALRPGSYPVTILSGGCNGVNWLGAGTPGLGSLPACDGCRWPKSRMMGSTVCSRIGGYSQRSIGLALRGVHEHQAPTG